MLPFTKRSARAEDAGDVSKKDDVAKSASASPASLREGGARRPQPSVSEEELTGVLSTASARAGGRAGLGLGTSRGGGLPKAAAPSVRAGARASARAGKVPNLANEEEEEGRTVVRGERPKIIKRTAKGKLGGPTIPTTVSPSAVIKATLESARGRGGQHDPDALLHPSGDVLDGLDQGAARGPNGAQSARGTAPVSVSGATQGMMQPGAFAAPSARAGATSARHGAFPYPMPPATGGAGHNVVAPPPSMPAHFMVPQAPYSEARMDPPGTSVTARTSVAGRPAMSWAVALLAFGLFVGVGAVAIMQGNTDGLVETSASFVDPSRAANGRSAGARSAPMAAVDEANVAVPVVAAPQQAPAAAVATAAPAAIAQQPHVAQQPHAAAPGTVLGSAPNAAEPRSEARAAAPARAPAYRAPSRPAAAPTTVAAADEERPKATKSTTKPGKTSEVDEEAKKALETLQKSQLESSF